MGNKGVATIGTRGKIKCFEILIISNFALTKSHIVLRVSYFQLLPIQITPKFEVFSLVFVLRLLLSLVTCGNGKKKSLGVFWV